MNGSARAGRVVRVGVAAVLVTAPLCLGVTVPAHAADGEECDVTALAESERLADTKVRASAPMARMHVPEAHEITDGTGVTVAV
ncbi:MAG TPA: hypothetical protein VNS46_15995, partial [Nocardioides sp.]|nr:hypothetical protein [Nocardioides sp.]